MTPVYFRPDDPINAMVGDFVSMQCFGEPDGFDRYCSMGVFDRGELVAGTVYHNWHTDHGTIELSSASLNARWLTRPVVGAMFAMAFNGIGARLCVLRVSEHNSDMRGIARRFGFEETVIPRVRGPQEAECIYTLSASDWAAHRMNR